MLFTLRDLQERWGSKFSVCPQIGRETLKLYRKYMFNSEIVYYDMNFLGLALLYGGRHAATERSRRAENAAIDRMLHLRHILLLFAVC